MQLLFQIIVSVFVLIVVGLVGASFYFYDMAVKRSRKAFLQDNQDLAPTKERETKVHPAPAEMSGKEWLAEQDCELWKLRSGDNLRLTGYYLSAHKATNKTVILAHGYTSQGKDMGSFARFYHEKLGYNVLMPDSRGHGQSEGNYIGFGWPDRKDYLLWIEKALERVGDDAQIVLHGISMGGATVLMVSGEKLSAQVKVIINDCGYTSAYDQLAYQLKRMYGLPAFPILPVTSLLTKIRVGYGFKEASALEQVKKTALPVLFIHGEKDMFVPTAMVFELYEACSSQKEIYIVKGAGHGNAYSTDRPAYEERVRAFLERFVR